MQQEGLSSQKLAVKFIQHTILEVSLIKSFFSFNGFILFIETSKHMLCILRFEEIFSIKVRKARESTLKLFK